MQEVFLHHQILENMLEAMHVRIMLVPCVTSLLGMWVHKLGFEPVTAIERAALEDQIILLDPETVHLVKKQIYRSVPPRPPPVNENGQAPGQPFLCPCELRVSVFVGAVLKMTRHKRR
jgi:hypothetical protein